MDHKNIILKLSVEEVNGILSAIGNLPYTHVFALIQKIQEQTEHQLNETQLELNNQVN